MTGKGRRLGGAARRVSWGCHLTSSTQLRASRMAPVAALRSPSSSALSRMPSALSLRLSTWSSRALASTASAARLALTSLAGRWSSWWRRRQNHPLGLPQPQATTEAAVHAVEFGLQCLEGVAFIATGLPTPVPQGRYHGCGSPAISGPRPDRGCRHFLASPPRAYFDPGQRRCHGGRLTGAAGRRRCRADSQRGALMLRPSPLKPSALRRRVARSSLGFRTTDHLADLDQVISQPRATQGLDLASACASRASTCLPTAPPRPTCA